jgi:Protein of unknown function (DUF3618)
LGQEPGKDGAVTTDELRTEIEQTRAELGETAAALGAKADVKSRAKERVHELKQDPIPLAAAAALLVGCAILWLVASRRGS